MFKGLIDQNRNDVIRMSIISEEKSAKKNSLKSSNVHEYTPGKYTDKKVPVIANFPFGGQSPMMTRATNINLDDT